MLNYDIVFGSETLNRNWNDTDVSILPIYRELIAAKLRIWVFRYPKFCLSMYFVGHVSTKRDLNEIIELFGFI